MIIIFFQLTSLSGLLHFASATKNYRLLQSSMILIMTILKHTTLLYPPLAPVKSGEKKLDDQEDCSNPNPSCNPHMIASKESIQSVLYGLLAALKAANSGCY